jgi:hypothetical protein
MVCDRRSPRLPRPYFEAVFKTNALYCDRQNFVSLPWRVMPFLRQNARDLIVMHSLVGQRVYALHHLLVPRQGGHGINRQCDQKLSGCAAAPHDTHLSLVAGATAHDDLFDQTA